MRLPKGRISKVYSNDNDGYIVPPQTNVAGGFALSGPEVYGSDERRRSSYYNLLSSSGYMPKFYAGGKVDKKVFNDAYSCPAARTEIMVLRMSSSASFPVRFSHSLRSIRGTLPLMTRSLSVIRCSKVATSVFSPGVYSRSKPLPDQYVQKK